MFKNKIKVNKYEKLILLGVLISGALWSQDIATLNHTQTQDIEYYRGIKNNSTVGEYIASDGNVFKVGDEVTLGSPQKDGGFESDFKYIQLGRIGGAMGALAAISSDVDTPMVPENFEGRKAKVGNIRVFHLGNKKKPLKVIVELVEPNGNAFTALTKRISIQNLEFALKYGEILPMNAKMSRDQAIAKLKEVKDLLELDMMSKEEYDALRTELSPIIRGN